MTDTASRSEVTTGDDDAAWRADPGWRELYERVTDIAADFAEQRAERQRRRELDPADFERLRQAGLPLIGVPRELGGLWQDRQRSMRPIGEVLRRLASGDSSVALVSAMHIPVLSPWLSIPEAPESFREAWQAQRLQVFQTVLDGAFWGTIVSEPGSGGDSNATRAVARPTAEPGRYLLSGQKHFGSGSGMSTFMTTVAVPEGESAPVSFFLNLRDVPWDGSQGVRLVAAWDGHGMTATQSHAMEFEDFPATRSAWQGRREEAQALTGGLGTLLFTAVIVGVVDTAFAEARRRLRPKARSMRAFERVEWSRAEQDEWLIHQAYAGMLRAMERPAAPNVDLLRGKTAIAELAQASLDRICRVFGGSSFSRRTPFGFWFEDVRALGFLRPPWSLAFDRLFEISSLLE